MNKFLSFTASILITASFLDALYFSGTGRPVHWIRDAVAAVAGIASYVFLILSCRKR